MVRRACDEVLFQAGLRHIKNAFMCQSRFDCVLHVTGPLMYDRAILQTARNTGCRNRWWKPQPARNGRPPDCAAAVGMMRDVHVCDDRDWQDPITYTYNYIYNI